MNVIVIGAGKGIGLEATKLFCEKNGSTVYAFSRNTGKLDEIQGQFPNLHIYKGDINQNESIEGFVKLLQNKNVRPDRILITAGVLVKKPFHQLSIDDFRMCFDTNVYSAFNVIRSLESLITDGPLVHIVTIGSMGGVTGSLKFPGMLFYSSSKAALSCLTECLAEEFNGRNIHINCLALGAVETEMKNQAFPDYKAPHSAEEMGVFLVDFTLNSGHFFNGKVLPVSVSTP